MVIISGSVVDHVEVGHEGADERAEGRLDDHDGTPGICSLEARPERLGRLDVVGHVDDQDILGRWTARN